MENNEKKADEILEKCGDLIEEEKYPEAIYLANDLIMKNELSKDNICEALFCMAEALTYLADKTSSLEEQYTIYERVMELYSLVEKALSFGQVDPILKKAYLLNFGGFLEIIGYKRFKIEEEETCEKKNPIEEALELFMGAFTIDPKCVEAYIGMASCFNGLGYHRKAVNMYNYALTLNPNENQEEHINDEIERTIFGKH